MDSNSSNQHDSANSSFLDRSGSQTVFESFSNINRKKAEIVLLVPITAVGDDLTALLQDASRRGLQVFYTICTGDQHSLKHTLRKDASVSKLFKLFYATKHLPFNLKDFQYHEWLARLLIPHLVLSTCKFKWGGITPTLLFRHCPNSLICKLIKDGWTTMEEKIRNDIEKILRNPERLFCFSCSNLCPLYMQPCHFNLDTFVKLDFSQERTEEKILTEIRLFGSSQPLGSPMYLQLHEKHSHIRNFSRDSVEDVLNIIGNHYNDSNYCCYMICVLNGPAMSFENEDERTFDVVINELLADESVLKFLYVGMTMGETFRASHLTVHKSPIYKVLTKHARMFILRRYVTKSRREAARNEAVIIELLKKTIKRNLELCIKTNYLLLNSHSEQTALLGADEKEASFILDSIDANLNIFSGNSTRRNLTYEPAFTGDYGFGYEHEIPEDHPCKERDFDDVKDYIDKVIARNKNATFTDLKLT